MKVKIFFSFSLLFFCCSKQIEEPVDVVNKAVESIVNMNYDELLELYDSSSQNIIKSRIETLSTKNKTTNSDNYKSTIIVDKEIINNNPKKIKFTLENTSKEKSFFYTIKVGDKWFLTL